MIGVGDEIARDGNRFRLTGISEGNWVAEPIDGFGPPVTLSGRDLAAFGVEASDPSDQADAGAAEAAGWNVLSEAHEANRLRDTPEAPTPEEIFSDLGQRR